MMGKKMGGYGTKVTDMNMNEPPEPEVLLSILHRKSKKWWERSSPDIKADLGCCSFFNHTSFKMK